MCCVASAMCASPTDVLRSMSHVCKSKGCYHTPPHPPPHVLRSISHVCTCIGSYHTPHPTPPPHVLHRAKRSELPRVVNDDGSINMHVQTHHHFSCEEPSIQHELVIQVGDLPLFYRKHWLMKCQAGQQLAPLELVKPWKTIAYIYDALFWKTMENHCFIAWIHLGCRKHP